MMGRQFLDKLTAENFWQPKALAHGKLGIIALLALLVPCTLACFTVVPASNRPEGSIGFSIKPPPTRATKTYTLEVAAIPSQAAQFVLSPKPDNQGIYPAGVEVTISVLSGPEWKVQRWVGAAHKVSEHTAKVIMDQDQLVVLHMVPAD